MEETNKEFVRFIHLHVKVTRLLFLLQTTVDLRD